MRDKRGVSNVIVFVLGLVIVVVIVTNVFLWNYEMNQLDWKKMKEDIAIVSVASTNETSSFNPSEYNLGGATSWVSGSVSNLITDDSVYMAFRSYSSGGTDTSDFVDNNISDVDASADKGTHGNFTTQKYYDSIYDTLREEDTGGGGSIVLVDLKTASSRKQTTLNIPDVTVSGTDRVLYVFLSCKTKNTGSGTQQADSVVWDSAGVNEAFSNVGFINTNKMATDIWVLIAPTAKTATVTVSDAGDNWNWDGAVGTAVALSGVDQTTPDDGYNSNSGTSSTASVTVASAPGDMVWDVISADQTTASVGSGQDQQWNSLETRVRGAGSNETGASSVIMNWTLGASTIWSSSGISINPTSAATNYELDLEVQWTNVDYDEANEYLCIYAGAMDAENLRVDYWTGSSWTNLFTDLTANNWNNVSVSLTSTTFTIRFKGGTETGDTTQDSWNIDATLLHVWTDQYTSEVEFIGTSNAYSWTQLNWTIDSQWTAASVSVTLQLYNFTLGDYPTSGQGYISYTSGAANTDQTQTQSINVNPTQFRNSTNHWKIKVTGIKNTTTQFDFKADWIEFKEVNPASLFTFENEGSPTVHLVSLWVNNSTHHQRYDINIFISSGDTESYTSSDITLPSVPYTVKVVTERGNIAIHSET